MADDGRALGTECLEPGSQLPPEEGLSAEALVLALDDLGPGLVPRRAMTPVDAAPDGSEAAVAEDMTPMAALVPLTVDLAGTGSGTVTSSPAGLSCTGQGTSCTASFEEQTTVTLTATPGSGATFAGWSGACSGTGTCQMVLTQARLAVATFTVPPAFVTRYYHSDAIRSVRLITDAAGAVVRRHDYTAFGEDAVPLTADSIRFTGKERDAESAFDYFGARYYRNIYGRFTTVDPEHAGGNVLDTQSWNAYAYSRNNPLRFVDPTGEDYVIALDGYDSFTVTDDVFRWIRGSEGFSFDLDGYIRQWNSRDGRWVVIGKFYWHNPFNAMIANAGHRAEMLLTEHYLPEVALSAVPVGAIGKATRFALSLVEERAVAGVLRQVVWGVTKVKCFSTGT